ncbi:MAG TPA: DNA polymerase III subunit delta [Candidatus Polarisedimenticolia bacterium]|nr:DNA polymerase III subunit delta [Candidatus Polarisedimenticolia bacterium]
MAPARRTTARAARGTTPAALLQAAGGGTPPSVLVITGRDSFTREWLLSGLRGALVPAGFEAFNYASFSGEDVVGEDLILSAGMLPMGGSHRMLVVRRAERIRDRELPALARYASSPSSSTCLCLVCEGSEKATLASALGAGATCLDLPAPRDYQLARWLEEQARRLDLPLDSDAARTLAEIAGEDFVGAMSQMQTAALAAAGRITKKSIERQLTQAKDTNLFHFADAVLSREPARAIGILRDLHDAGHTGYAILASLTSQLRRFLKMRARVEGGESARSVIQSTSPTLPPEVRGRLTKQLDSFGQDRLIDAFGAARAADRAIKSYGSGEELAHLERLVWRVSGA